MTNTSSKISKFHKSILCIPGFLAFVVYLVTMPATLQVGDAGEQITAAHILGIGHPTGTPLYLLLMKAWELVFPFGTIVWRMNLLSVLLGAITVIIFATLIYRISLYYSVSPTRGLILSLALSLTLAYSKTYWYEGIAASSYMLHALLVVIWLTVLARMILKQENQILYLLYLLTGMALANHVLSLILVFLTWWLSISLISKKEISLKRFACLQLYLVPGLLFYSYIPLRAAVDPPLNWGNPDSFGRFIHYILRLDYLRQVYVSTFVDFLEVLLFQAKSFLQEMSPVLLALALLLFIWHGIHWLKKRRIEGREWGFVARLERPTISTRGSKPSIQLIMAGIILMIFNLLVLALHGSHTDIFFWGRYMLTGYIGLLFSFAVFLLVTYSRNGSRFLSFLMLLTVIMPGVCLHNHFVENDRSKNTLVISFVEQVFSHLPEGVTFYLAGDNYLFPVVYYHLVEGKRSDLTLLNPEIGLGDEAMVASLIKEGKLYSSHYLETELPIRVVPAGLVFKLVHQADTSTQQMSWGSFSNDELKQARSPLEKTLVVDYYHRRSIYHENRNEQEERLFWINRMAEVAEGYDRTLMLTGRAFARMGLTAEAIRYFHAALAINPKNRAAQHYLEKIKTED